MLYMPKIYFFSLSFLCMPLLMGAQNKVSPQLLDKHNGLFFQRNHMEPFSGVAYEEYPNGKKKTWIPIKNGKIEGTATEWAPNGNKTIESTYVNGQKEGVETQWYPGGAKKLEIPHQNGLANGWCTEWYESGAKKSEGEYVAGKEEGVHLWYYENGSTYQKVPFEKGEPHGTAKIWHLNGTLKAETAYQQGLQHGPRVEWFDNGQMRSQFVFENGEEEGEARVWNAKGRLIEWSKYQAGQLLEEKDYRSGQIRSKSGYFQVFNTADRGTQVHIHGQEVNCRNARDMVYVVDGILLQVQHLFPDPKWSLSENQPDTSALLAFMETEQQWIEGALDHPLEIEREFGVNEGGIPWLHWSFAPPPVAEEDQNPRTVVKEHYLSLLCGDQMLNIYVIETQSDKTEAVLDLLEKVGDSVRTREAAYDLNQLIDDIKKE